MRQTREIFEQRLDLISVGGRRQCLGAGVLNPHHNARHLHTTDKVLGELEIDFGENRSIIHEVLRDVFKVVHQFVVAAVQIFREELQTRQRGSQRGLKLTCPSFQTLLELCMQEHSLEDLAWELLA